MAEEIFVILDYPNPNNETGKYVSLHPHLAASKAFSQIVGDFDIDNTSDEKRYLKFAIKNKRTNKIYEYIGAKIKLYKPVKINNIYYKYRNLILPKPKCINFNIIKNK